MVPVLNTADILSAIPKVEWLGAPRKGGQKVVFPCKIGGAKYALKLLIPGDVPEDSDWESERCLDEVTARARREVEIMGQCRSPHLVKLGPLPLATCKIGSVELIYFTEEWIEGSDLGEVLKSTSTLSIVELVRLGQHITNAIKELWSLAKIHRDIKPGNIMRRDSSGDFVLLDMGLAFDLQDESLSVYGAVPGTQIFFSPEQAEFAKKRQLDFRSDLFSLGIVLYCLSTGRHPFWSHGMSSQAAIAAIQGAAPPPPSSIQSSIPPKLDQLILRLLEKKPHLRYRTCDQLLSALADIPL